MNDKLPKILIGAEELSFFAEEVATALGPDHRLAVLASRAAKSKFLSDRCRLDDTISRHKTLRCEILRCWLSALQRFHDANEAALERLRAEAVAGGLAPEE